MSTGTDPFGDAYQQPESDLDTIGWFIATLHNLTGHDKTAAFIGAPPGDKNACLICVYERYPSTVNRQAVLRALAPVPPDAEPPA